LTDKADDQFDRRARPWRWEMLADFGLSDTVVHGDFHPGNRHGSCPSILGLILV